MKLNLDFPKKRINTIDELKKQFGDENLKTGIAHGKELHV